MDIHLWSKTSTAAWRDKCSGALIGRWGVVVWLAKSVRAYARDPAKPVGFWRAHEERRYHEWEVGSFTPKCHTIIWSQRPVLLSSFHRNAHQNAFPILGTYFYVQLWNLVCIEQLRRDQSWSLCLTLVKNFELFNVGVVFLDKSTINLSSGFYILTLSSSFRCQHAAWRIKRSGALPGRCVRA